MQENEILELGFKKIAGDYILGNISVIGTTLVEVFQNGEFIHVKNCKTIEDLKQLMKLFL